MPSLLTREAVVASRTQAAALVGVGLGLWVVGTLTVRFAGQALFPSDDPGRVAFVFAATVPLLSMVAFAVYSLLDVPPERRLTAAALLVLPGMLLDAGALAAFERLFPDVVPSAPAVGGVLLLAYAVVLLTGIVPLRYVQEESTAPGDSVDHPAERDPPEDGGDAVGDG